jgi:AcrR family transcriptional regulator
MNPQIKAKPDDTRARIVEAAEVLFLRLGYAKTAVADIAAELKMSPANVYRFFPSKNAIVEAICQRTLAEVEEQAWAIARAKAPAADRLERLTLGILKYHKENCLSDNRVQDIVLVAIENSWAAIRAHKETIRTIVEVILRDGMATGELETIDPRHVSEQFMHATVGFCHPVLVAQSLQDGEDIESSARDAVRFILRAIIPRT